MTANRHFLSTLLFVFSLSLIAQTQPTRKHTVQKGETVYGISRQYEVSEAKILELNPDVAEEGLKEGQILIIPAKEEKVEEEVKLKPGEKIHIVKPGETLFAISREYNVPVAEIKKANPSMDEALDIGQKVIIPLVKSTQLSLENGYRFYEVQPGETVYSITRENNISQEEFFRLNPQVKESGLQSAMLVKLPQTEQTERLAEVQDVSKAVKEELSSDEKTRGTERFTLYQLREGDNLDTLLKKFKVDRKTFLDLNPELIESIVPGRFVVVPRSSVPRTTDRGFTAALANTKMNLELWLPLKAGEDSLSGINSSTNISLEFYAGLRIALDTLSKSGMNISLKVKDTHGNRSHIKNLASMVDDSTRVVIGPVYSQNVEEAAPLLASKNKFVISPLSIKTDVRKNPNLISLIPNHEAELEAIAQYLNKVAMRENIIFINSDKKKLRYEVSYLRTYMNITENTQIFESWVDANEFPKQAYYKNLIVPGKKNYIVTLDEDQALMADMLSKISGLHDTSIVLVGLHDLLENETIDLKHLNELNYVTAHPMYVDFDSEEVNDFVRKYRKIYNADPGKYALLGYDLGIYLGNLNTQKNITFDTHNIPNHGLITNIRFVRRPGEGYRNVGVKILQLKDYRLHRIY